MKEILDVSAPIGAVMEAIDPARAAEILATSPTYQRPLRVKHVESLAAQMTRDEFGMTMIQMGVRNGCEHLIDGHHRLSALIESGKTIPFLVWRRPFASDPAMEQAYTQIDGGIRRSKADIQRVIKLDEMIGVPLRVIKAATTAVGIIASNFDNTAMGNTWKRMEKYGIVTRQQQAESPFLFSKEIYAYWRICNIASNQLFSRLLNPAVMAVGLVCFRFQPEKAESLWNEVSMADGLRRGSPAWYMTEGIQDSKTIGTMTRYIASCWNAHYEVREMGKTITPHVTLPITIGGTPWRGKATTEIGQRMIDDMWKGKGLL